MTTIQQAIFLDGGPGQIDYWFNQLTDTNANSSTGYSLSDHAFDSLGNIVVAGTSVNNTWPDNKHFWHKIGKNGDILVTRTFSDSNSASDVTEIAIDSSDNIYAALGNARFVKWDSSYNIVYSKQNTWSNSNQNYGDSGVGGGSLTLSGNTLTYYSIGSNRRAMQVDASTGETTSATTASAGNHFVALSRGSKTSQGDFLCGYVQGPSTNNDNYWMVATTSLTQQFCFYSGSTEAICRGIDYINGNYYIVGMRNTDGSFAGDALMYKLGSYSSSGNQGILWSRRIRNINNISPGSYQSQFYDVAGDSEGNIYTVGNSPDAGTISGGIIMKFNSSGTIVWSRFIQHTNGATYVNKLSIDSNDTLWVNIDVRGSAPGSSDVCGVAKLPSNGLFIGTYCGFTVTDWSNGFNSSYQSFNHNAQSGAVPTFLSGGSSLTLGSPVTVSYTEPTVPGSSGQCKSTLPTNGQAEFTTTGTYTWVAPPDVTSVSVVAIGGGAGGAGAYDGTQDNERGAGGGGGLGYKNNISVTPGQSYTVVVGYAGTGGQSGPNSAALSRGTDGGDSYFIDATTVKGGAGRGGTGADGGYQSAGGDFVGDNQNVGNSSNYNGRNGGYGELNVGFGGAGAAGYGGCGAGSGAGVTGASGGGSGKGASANGSGGVIYSSSGGGGTGIYGEGSTGSNGSNVTPPGRAGGGGSGGENGEEGTAENYQGKDGGKYGGGGGVGSIQVFAPGVWYGGSGGDGGGGAVRIIWPGTIRQFPTTGTEKL